MQNRKENFQTFIEWFEKHIKGYEKGEGQLFFNRLLQAFGNQGVLEVGATCEERVKKRKGTTGFADFVWKPRAVIELKERGTNLSKHYEQAFEYWWTLVPNRPQYMILCNFDEFWIYDLNTQINDPVHKLSTKNLVNDWGALAFLFPKAEKPVFNNNNVEVTEEAAKIVGSMFFSMANRKVDPIKAQKFVLQIVVALFSEDVGLIPKYTIHKILEEAVKNPVTQKEMSDLFLAMATEKISSKAKKYKDIPFFNGGIFHDVEAVELNYKELDLLYEASKQDWSKVRPSIFGSIFEASMDQGKRHDIGAHYTSELDIQKIVFPSIVKPLRGKIDAVRSKKDLAAVLKEIRSFRVLDPACGSGNFLYIAFRELRRLEVEVMELVSEKEKSSQIGLSLVTPRNFYGIDTNSFGIELAKVALCIGRKISADEFGIQDNILPFENLEDNFLSTDALFTEWPEVDAIIGNPPFLGSRKMRESGMTDDYIKKLWSLYPGKDFPKSADYCCYWFRKAQSEKANYVGLVGTNSISQNESRKASLDFITSKGGIIHYAISTQVWSGDANVHVSVVNWIKSEWSESKILDGREVDTINSSLKNEFDVTSAKRLLANKNICFQGVVPIGKFEISQSTAASWIKKDKKNQDVIKVFFSGTELTEYPDYNGSKYIVDFNDLRIESAAKYSLPFKHIEELVKPQRAKVRRKAHKLNWWHFGDKRPALRKAIKSLPKYIAVPGHSKWTIPVVVPSSWLPYVNSSFAVASDDFYLLGIMTSKLHRDWVIAQSSTIKADTRYTNTTCFDTFPFIWDAEDSHKKTIREIMKRLDDFRLKTMKENNIGITKLYNQFFYEPASMLHKVHEELNKACCHLYGWKYIPNKNYNDELYDLNQEMYKKEAEVNVSIAIDFASETIKRKKLKKLAKGQNNFVLFSGKRLAT